MDTIFQMLSYVTSGLLLIFFIIKIYYSNINDPQIDSLITEYFEKLEMNVVLIDTLNFTEKLKYGVPINSLFSLYGYFFTFFSLKVKPVRKVELKDRNDNEFTKYVELIISKRKLISCNEFDSYNI